MLLRYLSVVRMQPTSPARQNCDNDLPSATTNFKRLDIQCVTTGNRFSFRWPFGRKKTRERIRLSFYWPNLRQDVQQYIQTCTECQLRSRPTTLDRVPITPITRVDLPFQVLNMDCIGPIDPPSTQGHRYCLCIVDNCTRLV